MGQEDFNSKFKDLASIADAWCESYCDSLAASNLLSESIKYCVRSGGKRIRPVLCIATANALGVEAEQVRPFALALELLHTSSLVHDDLPALDNDDLRRGIPSCHKKFGEALAVLTGDALMMAAFELIAKVAPGVAGDWTGLLAKAGMALCRGQALDLILGKKIPGFSDHKPSGEELRLACLEKTAALFRAAVMSPLSYLSQDAAASLSSELETYGLELGLLFQISDDLLDAKKETQSQEYDFVQVYGRSGAERLAAECVERGAKVLTELPGDFSFHRALLEVVRTRTA